VEATATDHDPAPFEREVALYAGLLARARELATRLSPLTRPNPGATTHDPHRS
jgi:hypothetical protein